MHLSVVVIGKNQAMQLKCLVAVLKKFQADEVIYVDSCSHDSSLAVAKEAGWITAVLHKDSVISASAGRHVGTLLARSEWILYLDGDMVPDWDVIKSWLNALELNKNFIGVTGAIVDVYPDGARRIRLQKSQIGDRAKWFGGSVVINRSAVLSSGNWNPFVYANEELDLYARLASRGWKVGYVDKSVDHHTERYDYWKVFFSQLGLYDPKNMKNGSFGYVIRSAVEDGSFFSLLKINPEPFILWLLGCFALAAPFISSWVFPVPANIVAWLWVAHRRGWPYILWAYLLFPQALIGIFRYRKRKLLYTVL